MPVTVLDGGMGRELKRMGAPFRQPEWSALALMEAPDTVRQAHEAFARAGAVVITTNSYALVPFHIGEDRFAADAEMLAARAGRCAREAVDATGARLVAGSLPPLFGSYRPDLFDASRAAEIIAPLVRGLRPHVDIWLGETLSAITEARVVRAAIGDDPRPLWISFTLEDDAPDAPRLRSGELVTEAVAAVAGLHASAILFNCAQPEVMLPAIRAAKAVAPFLPVGVYANAFPPKTGEAEANADLSPLRDDLTPPGYLAFARQWVDAGARIVGGCCGIGPEHIAEISKAFGPAARG